MITVWAAFSFVKYAVANCMQQSLLSHFLRSIYTHDVEPKSFGWILSVKNQRKPLRLGSERSKSDELFLRTFWEATTIGFIFDLEGDLSGDTKCLLDLTSKTVGPEID